MYTVLFGPFSEVLFEELKSVDPVIFVPNDTPVRTVTFDLSFAPEMQTWLFLSN